MRDANGDLNLKALTERLRWVKENTEEVTGQISALECDTGPGFDVVIVAGESRFVLGSLGGTVTSASWSAGSNSKVPSLWTPERRGDRSVHPHRRSHPQAPKSGNATFAGFQITGLHWRAH